MIALRGEIKLILLLLLLLLSLLSLLSLVLLLDLLLFVYTHKRGHMCQICGYI